MAYRTKQDTIELAEQLGIDVSGMTWPQMQKAVSDALKANDNDKRKVSKQLSDEARYLKRKRINKEMLPYLDKKVMIAPEMYADAKRYVHYTEDLGDDLEVEEISFLGMEGGRINWRGSADRMSGTYRVKGKNGRKVVATSALPRQNAGISIDPGDDWFPVIEFNGKKGYLYKHPSMYCFKSMLDDLNLYDAYRTTLQRSGVVFYLTGLLCIDIPVAHAIMRDIEKRAARGELDDSWLL